MPSELGLTVTRLLGQQTCPERNLVLNLKNIYLKFIASGAEIPCIKKFFKNTQNKFGDTDRCLFHGLVSASYHNRHLDMYLNFPLRKFANNFRHKVYIELDKVSNEFKEVSIRYSTSCTFLH